jgi:hypothetical protein
VIQVYSTSIASRRRSARLHATHQACEVLWWNVLQQAVMLSYNDPFLLAFVFLAMFSLLFHLREPRARAKLWCTERRGQTKMGRTEALPKSRKRQAYCWEELAAPACDIFSMRLVRREICCARI